MAPEFRVTAVLRLPAEHGVEYLIVGGVGIYQANQINGRGNQIYGQDQVGTGLAAILGRDAGRVQANVLEHVLALPHTRDLVLAGTEGLRDPRDVLDGVAHRTQGEEST